MTLIEINQRELHLSTWAEYTVFHLSQQRPSAEMLDPGSTAVREGTYLLPSEVLASTPGGVLFPMKPIVRVYRDHQDKQGLCPQEVPAWGTAGLHPGDDSTTAGGARARHFWQQEWNTVQIKGPLKYKNVKSELTACRKSRVWRKMRDEESCGLFTENIP